MCSKCLPPACTHDLRLSPKTAEVGLIPGDIVLDGDPAPHPQKEGAQQPPTFGPCLMWPNGWMDEGHAIWYAGRPRPRPHCV